MTAPNSSSPVSPLGDPHRPESRPSSFLQLRALVRKNAILKIRGPIGCAFETVLPIIFISGLVIIWSFGANTVVPDTMFVADNATTQPIVSYGTQFFPPFVCENVTELLASPSLWASVHPAYLITTTASSNPPSSNASSPLSSGNATTSSAPALSAIPIYASPYSVIPGVRPCTVNETVAPPFECLSGPPIAEWRLCVSKLAPINLVFAWLDFDRPRLIPTFDEYVLTQWLALGAFPRAVRSQYGSVYNALVNAGGLHFSPVSRETAALISYFNSTTKFFHRVYGSTFPNMAAAYEHTGRNTETNPTWAVIEVHQLNASGLSVTLHFNRSGIPWTFNIRDRFNANGQGRQAARLFAGAGFLTLQGMIDTHYMLNVQNFTAAELPPRPTVVPMPFKGYINSEFLTLVGTLAPLIIVFAYLYAVSQLVKRMVEEKELRIREAMMIMGLNTVPFYLSWLITYLPQNIVAAGGIAIICHWTMLPQTDAVIVFVLFLLFSISTIAFAALLSSFFSKSRLAALVSPVIFFLTTIPSFALPADSGTEVFVGLSLLCPTAFGVGTKLIMQYEINSGFQWGDFANTLDKVNMGGVFALLVGDSVLYMLLALYFDAVLPSDWGQRKHPLFFVLDPIAFCRRSKKAASSASATSAGGNHPERVSHSPAAQAWTQGSRHAPVIEDIARGADERPAVTLQQLTKRFVLDSGETLIAVNDLSLTLYEGDINVLLGHNGAGKTTAINLMTGMLDVDEGDCHIYGYSVVTEMDKVRREIGFCPQHNILFHELTCREHLEFFCMIKGIQGDAMERSVVDMLNLVDLREKENVRAGNLSGGQKRKLSVGIAFTGSSRMIFLDEPTAGMDVGARRFTWDLIKKMSKGRTIVLTTHYMDEADLLGNTISIMAKGKLRCSGSSSFLKARLGAGYTLTVAVEKHRTDCQLQTLELVQSIIGKANVGIVSQTAGELAVRLPTETASQFPLLLKTLESRTAELCIRGMGLSITTLEEIFLRIGEGDDEDDDDEGAAAVIHGSPGKADGSASPSRGSGATDAEGHDDYSRNSPDASHHAAARSQEGDDNVRPHPSPIATPAPEPEKTQLWSNNEQRPSFAGQLGSLLLKRFHNAKRDRRTQCLQIALPIVCIAVSMALTSVSLPVQPRLQLTGGMYLDGRSECVVAGCPEGFDSHFDANANVVTVVNVSRAVNLSRYLLQTAKSHRYERLSSFYCQDASLYPPVAPTSVVFMNNSGFKFAAPQALNEYNKVYLRHRLAIRFNTTTAASTLPPSSSGTPQRPASDIGLGILPLSIKESAQFESVVTLLIGLFILIPFSFIPSTFVSFVVKERECKATHLQYVSGMNYFAYWLSNLIFDLCSFVVSVALAFVVFAIFNRTEYVGGVETGFATCVVFLLYGFAGVGSSYAVSFFFDHHDTAQNVVMLANFICGFLLVLVIYFLDILGSTRDVATVLRYIFRLIPSYSLGEGIINLASMEFLRLISRTKSGKSPFDLDVVGWDLIYLGFQGPVLLGITLLVDHPARQLRAQQLLGSKEPAPKIDNEDDDVAEERRLIEQEGGAAANGFDRLATVKGLRKVYPTPNGDKVAVKNLSFGVERGEVFAFLGTNGAGKTTTISILCGEFLPTTGVCTVGGSDVVADSQEARKKIGYCPQFDALHDLLTPAEHLFLYAGLRGVPTEEREALVERLLMFCGLDHHRFKVARSLSGGNKRKLSVAISLIGGPLVVFLDEPSAGMDPKARRGLWTIIQGIASRCSVVLTTHHLEEVEVLATRVGIMVDGELKCLGPLQRLKNKFGADYEVTMRFATDDALEDVKKIVLANLAQGVRVVEQRNHRLTLSVPLTVPLSDTFLAMEQARSSNMAFLDYSVTQASLEQVFLRIGASSAVPQDE